MTSTGKRSTASISGYSRTLWQKINNRHPLTFFFIVLLAASPLKLGVGNIALMVFAAASIWQFRLHRHVRIDWRLLLPVALFALMLCSLLWTIDLPRSQKALPRMIYLIVIPLCCLLFPAFTRSQKTDILQKYGYAMTAVALYFLLKAISRYVQTGDTGVFFYHELVTEEVNAIYISVFFAVAFFALFTKTGKHALDWCCCMLLACLLVLLSSKNLLVVFGFLLVLYFLFFSGLTTGRRILVIGTMTVLSGILLLAFPKLTDRFRLELATATGNGGTSALSGGQVNNVSVSEAWHQQEFSQNDFFAGAAFRVYQFRIFTEMLHEDPIFWTGYGLNASFSKIGAKAAEHKLFTGDGIRKGYHGKNFHNQYVQNFAELGIFGLLILLAILFLNLKNGIGNKDFTHISFAVLMISLFLTESFLLRQRGVMFFTAMYCLFNSGVGVYPNAKKE